jgi:hypothetical protein
MYRYLALALAILFLTSVARFYHPGTGFTALLGLPAGHDYEAPALRAIPHYDYPARASYDGQFYVQRALDPLFRDPAVDRAMDSGPFRARRILFSWTAYALGLGRPRWIVEAYALQNVLCWLLLGLVLPRWMPLTSIRGLALWAACLFSHGMLWSVRFSLLDGPSLLLIACAVLAVERGRPLLAAAVVGVSGLGRETNLLAAMSQPAPSDRRSGARFLIALLLVALPVLLWYDYLRSIYRSTLLAHPHLLVLPGTGLLEMWRSVHAGESGVISSGRLLMLSLAVQAVYLVVRREYKAPWWRVAAAYAALMLMLDVNVGPHTGAITRVLLPLTAGFNVLLATEHHRARFWPWFACGNLHLVPALWMLRII